MSSENRPTQPQPQPQPRPYLRPDAPARLVEQGYDAMAEGYLASKDDEDSFTLGALEELALLLPPGARVLDLGCGAGVPATRWLASRGYAVTGLDISERQIQLARRHVPGAHFIKADIADADFPPGSFDAVTAFYSIIHVPRELHAPLAGRIYRWLAPGGAFLATWPLEEWEGTEENWEGWGATMWWSHYGGDAYRAVLAEAGFRPVWERISSGRERWLWVLAQK